MYQRCSQAKKFFSQVSHLTDIIMQNCYMIPWRCPRVDGNLSFGNVRVFLNLPPCKSILQLIGDPAGIG
jgi:hypothetical protein